MVLQYHLYQNPVYKFVSKDEKEINVVLIGFNKFGQKFLDSCLQVVQSLSQKLTVKVFSAESSVFEEYQNSRPELKNFFSINEIDTSKDSYGNILFDSSVVEYDENELTKSLSGIADNLHYVFIDLGDDSKNYAVAIACKKIIQNNACVSFVRESLEFENEHDIEIIPIFVNAEVEHLPLYKKIDRMAFNAHLVWEKDLNLNYTEVRKKFEEQYNRDACIALVLSIKYKLYDFGLNIDNMDELEIARAFSERNFNNTERNNFIFSEHKRWVTEKICNGWKRRAVKDCADGLTKDAHNKTHVCIVKSRADRLLKDKIPPEKWATLNENEIAKLDELDKVSLRLHRMYVSQATAVKNESDVIQSIIENIQVALDSDPKIAMSFQEWKVCFENIWNGDAKKVRLYKSLTDLLKKNVEHLSANILKNIKANFDILENKIRPILSSMEFCDYKQADEAMVESIPFILTYSLDICLAIPFAEGEISELFGNVAAATVINPKKIIYLVLCNDLDKLNNFKSYVPNLIAYMKRKQLRAKIEFVIACKESVIEFEKEISTIESVCPEIIQGVQFVSVKSAKNPAPEVTNEFKKILLHQIKTNPTDFTALEVNSTVVSNWMQGADICLEIPSYSFDSSKMDFISINQCEAFGYIGKKNFITVNDLTALNNSFGRIGNQPTFFRDYVELWTKYKENSGRDWKSLCGKLQKYSDQNDVIASFSRKKIGTNFKRYKYILPAFCFKTVQKIIQMMIKEEVVNQKSAVLCINFAACEVIILDYCDNKENYDKLFADPYKLELPESIKFSPKQVQINVLFDNLIVKDLELNNSEIKLIEFFQTKNYLYNLTILDQKKYSFTYATRDIKNLLTNEGKILEIYVYHTAKNIGKFDDVVANFEPHWNDIDISNEFDCVMIKNFRMLIVECKAQNQISQDVYFKLFGLVKKFGINAMAVLVTDTFQTHINNLQQRRGNELNIVTIQSNVDNIGESLFDAINCD